jgi:hypothetical protein
MSNRRPTTIAQKASEAYKDALINFLIFLEKMRHNNKYHSIYRADETAVWLDESAGNCIEKEGSKEVKIN